MTYDVKTPCYSVHDPSYAIIFDVQNLNFHENRKSRSWKNNMPYKKFNPWKAVHQNKSHALKKLNQSNFFNLQLSSLKNAD